MARPYPSRHARFLLGVSLGIALLLAPSGLSLAAWSAAASGGGTGAAPLMPTGATPSGASSSSSVTVSWAAAELSNGTPVAGYVLNRYNSSTGAPSTVGAGCSGIVTATSCTEESVPAGTWVYTDTPVQMNWTGTASAESAPIVVSSG